LIEQSAKGEGGAAFMLVEAKGVVWNITFPLRERPTMNPAVPELLAEAEQEPTNSNEKETLRLKGKRLLVVEDEALIAMDIVAARRRRR
jgi:hypothetical protein